MWKMWYRNGPGRQLIMHVGFGLLPVQASESHNFAVAILGPGDLHAQGGDGLLPELLRGLRKGWQLSLLDTFDKQAQREKAYPLLVSVLRENRLVDLPTLSRVF